ncbi:rhomboid family intramembrane serine protease [Terrimonas sp.]|uniref:rhomboid family intramembrane serine protease n=1 Tax=Terrimonas sp. TaxID=1914338 RepID=UPI000D50DB2C|nr:rhomboid family intramembrane serine protease [Terrimonas sp.]PVD53695.1 rhomboid family intramembrane serine protease [Terrimonas sp.]
MEYTIIISLLIIAANVIVSNKGFKNIEFFSRYSFEVEKVTLYKQYDRIVTSGFLHVNWMHLIFNMLSLFLFSGSLAAILNPFSYLLVYFGSLICGNLFALLIHKKDSDYSSVGASGAVSGLIFAAIALSPGFSIGLFFIPIGIPAWIFGLAFVLYSIYGIRSRKTNVGHEAHLGSAITGLLIGILLDPSVLRYNLFPILVILIPSLIFLYVIIKKPHLLMVDNLFYKQHSKYYTIEDKYNSKKANAQRQVDQILEKIHKRGMNSLTRKEKEILDEYSKTVR